MSVLFRRGKGVVLSQYLSEYRTRKAKEMLTESELPIKDVAARVGYSSYNAFAYAFAKAEGISPSRYRQKGPDAPPLADRGEAFDDSGQGDAGETDAESLATADPLAAQEGVQV